MSIKVRDPFVEHDELQADESAPRFASAGDGRDYTWGGVRYPRVTWYLSHISNEYLMGYAAKVAALSAAKPLIDAGLIVPHTSEPDAKPYDHGDVEFDLSELYPSADEASQSQMMAEIEKYVSGFAMMPKTPGEALMMAVDYTRHMKAHLLYRDWKGHIGTVAHLFKAEYAMGLKTTAPDIDYLSNLAYQKVRLSPDMLSRFEQLGKKKHDVYLDLGYAALPHCQNVIDFVESYKPEYEFIGIEALVVNREMGYAGSLDEIANYRQDVWRELNSGKWPFDPSRKVARVVADLKTSNHLAHSVRYQLAAYRGAEFIGLLADGTENALPECHGAIALHSKPGEGIEMTPYHSDLLDHAFDAFCALVDFVRMSKGMPRITAGRKIQKAKRGERECPIMIGGAR